MTRPLFTFIAGMWPLWLAMLHVVRTHGQGDSADAPWLILFALPLCLFTVLIAYLAARVHAAVPGERLLRLAVALLSFVGLHLAALGLWKALRLFGA